MNNSWGIYCGELGGGGLLRRAKEEQQRGRKDIRIGTDKICYCWKCQWGSIKGFNSLLSVDGGLGIIVIVGDLVRVKAQQQ